MDRIVRIDSFHHRGDVGFVRASRWRTGRQGWGQGLDPYHADITCNGLLGVFTTGRSRHGFWAAMRPTSTTPPPSHEWTG